MNKRLLIGAVIIVVSLVAAWGAFQDSLTAYVDFDKARRMNKNCQVMGNIVKDEVVYDIQSATLRFPITDEDGDRLEVHYSGVVPGNFDQAESVVAIGRYKRNRFEAERLLVKCPSKYQGFEDEGEENPYPTPASQDSV